MVHLEEREIEGFYCSALLVPRDWTLRVHHDVRSDGSVLAVAHLEQPDCTGSTLYIAQHCVPCASAAATMQQLHEDLQQQQRRAVTSQHLWEERVSGTHTLVLCVALFASSPDTAPDAIAAVASIATDLRERLHQYSHRPPKNSPIACDEECRDAGVVTAALCSPRCCCVFEVRAALSFGPSPRHERLLAAAAHFGLEAQCFAESPDAGPLLLALLPHVSHRVWVERLRAVGGCAELMATRATVRPDGVEPRGCFVYVPPGALAWRVEARVGSDCCAVLLTEAPAAIDTGEAQGFNAGQGIDPGIGQGIGQGVGQGVGSLQSSPLAQCRARCAWLHAHVSLRVAATAVWSPLCRKAMGSIVRCGGLVVRVPHGVVAADALPMPRVATGAIALRGIDAGEAREVTIALLRDFRSAADYAEYARAEFSYDRPPEAVMETLRRRKTHYGPRGAEEAHMQWLRLGGTAAVYVAVRECGPGRLLLAQAPVLSGFDEMAAQRWEAWVDAIEAAPVG